MVALVGVSLVWEKLELPGSIGWRARRFRKRENERLFRTSPADLLAEARKAVRYEQWERFAPARALFQEEPWTDERLLGLLEELYAALAGDDRAKGLSGRSGSVFEFYDCGLASITEALEKRTRSAGGRGQD